MLSTPIPPVPATGRVLLPGRDALLVAVVGPAAATVAALTVRVASTAPDGVPRPQ